ncbi:MAG: ATP-dependent DNA helicase RecG [Bacteroidota bacterium]|nr:ATP-dependent DNA helicase RecG [Bacteroidota bacterium]
MAEVLPSTPVEFLKGVGPKRSDALVSELGIRTCMDLLLHLPFRYEDRSQFHRIADIQGEHTAVQMLGVITQAKEVRGARGSRLIAVFDDGEATMELQWFRGAQWILRNLPVQKQVVIYGKPNLYKGKWNIAHPEVELLSHFQTRKGDGLHPVYSSTEKLGRQGLHSQGLAKLIRNVAAAVQPAMTETLPERVLKEMKLMGRAEALRTVHAPSSPQEAERAQTRLRFEELFLLQLTLLQHKKTVTEDMPGVRFAEVGDAFNTFYHDRLPFELTDAQKRVLREIRGDLNTGWHMNRLLQGDVGSGKTVVALLTALLAKDNGYQAAIMAPTEILAQQHLEGLREMLGPMEVRVELLTGSVKGAARKTILADLKAGDIDILVGTHALIEPTVVFDKLGLAVIDEQHRFGVAQRAKLWKKAKVAPHILVMTATPIPRTLAMTAYGDLDASILDELPPGRKPIQTVHRTDAARLGVFQFLEDQIAEGRQIYLVYPLIEESATLDHKDLMDGYESIVRRFPAPDYQVAIVHGRMKPEDKAWEMDRFAKGQAQILVATTVIEVGVNVPNASVMVIESAERFGLSQLHQLRGRVGRGASQSYCILMSSSDLGQDARRRLETMCRTNDGFEIAEVDMELRGPGDVMGTQQSGVPDLKVADLVRDRPLLSSARYFAQEVLEADPTLGRPEHMALRESLETALKARSNWVRIS